jgi:hypothetical protein
MKTTNAQLQNQLEIWINQMQMISITEKSSPDRARLIREFVSGFVPVTNISADDVEYFSENLIQDEVQKQFSKCQIVSNIPSSCYKGISSHDET